MSDNQGFDDSPGPLAPGTQNTGANPCDEYGLKMLRFLENDLEGQELEEFRSHLKACASCQSDLEKEKELSQVLRRSRPLYSAPAALRSRISAAAEATPTSLHGRVFRGLASRLACAVQKFFSWRALVPAAIVLALCLALVPNVVRNVRAANYVDAAVVEHQSYLDGSLPVGLQSSSSELVTAWFAHKVPFDFRLPASGIESAPAYRLTGASVVSYKGSPAALVMYETQNEKISLLVVSSDSAVVAGGEEVQFGKLTFHDHTDSRFRVITWSNHSLSYALVSSVSGPARASCLVCHESMTDKGAFNTHP
jgi:anti-sigma factor (TIGR02949 family)